AEARSNAGDGIAIAWAVARHVSTLRRTLFRGTANSSLHRGRPLACKSRRVDHSSERVAVFQQVAQVVRTMFNHHADLTRETTSLDVDGWDSLTHTRLMLSVETALRVRLPAERTGALANLGELADLVQSPLAAPGGSAT